MLSFRVDVAIYESVLNMMEGIIPNYDRTGSIRGPSGSGVTGIVPTTAFRCKKPASFVIIGGNNDRYALIYVFRSSLLLLTYRTAPRSVYMFV